MVIDSVQPLTRSQINLACQAVWGSSCTPISAAKLSGGTQNETWLLEFADRSRVVLKVAPPSDALAGWDDRNLLRREATVYPSFLPVSDRMPRLLAVDFSHRLIPRDYSFQTFLTGRRWADVDETLPLPDRLALWQELGQITRQIHSVTGSAFGYPPPAQSFPCWSDTVLDRFDHLLEDFTHLGLETISLTALRRTAEENRSRLDELVTPCLLHGDLWTFNILIDDGQKPPAICGILDAEHAWWGDPRVDWGMFLLSLRRAMPEWREPITAFEMGYGEMLFPEKDLFYTHLYQGMHIALAAAQAARQQDQATVQKGLRDLPSIVQKLLPLSAHPR